MPKLKDVWIIGTDEDPSKTFIKKVKFKGFVAGDRDVPDVLYQVPGEKGYLKVHRGRYYFEEAPAHREMAFFCALREANLKARVEVYTESAAAFKKLAADSEKIYTRIEKKTR